MAAGVRLVVARLLTCAVLLAWGTAVCADFPRAEISNREIHAKLLLPNSDNGYYRGSRFDWAGVIESLTYKGHTYFGDRKSTRLNSSHMSISYAVFCLKKKKKK